MKKVLITIIALGILLSSISTFARTNTHVRVVLDLSKSLSLNRPNKGWPTDPGRLLILSALLLHDLVHPNSSKGDSFEVIPFDRHWKCPPGTPNAPLPSRSRRRSIKSVFDNREKFVKQIQNLKYNARCTYFYPGINRAIKELKNEGGDYDSRVIILLTDGVPETHVYEEESRRIKDELIPKMKDKNIRLYVLAFGDQALKNKDFFEPINEVGGFEVVRNSEELLDGMVEIFTRSFAYTAEKVQPAAAAKLNLERNLNPSRVAAVVLSDDPTKPPTINLTKPINGALINPRGMQSAKVKGMSYSLRWVLAPSQGDYKFNTDLIAGSVLVLRPTRLELELHPSPPETKQILKTMAEPAKFPLKVLVKPPFGIKGDPGVVNISFRAVGKRIRNGNNLKCAKRYRWCDKWNGIQSQGKIKLEGREYEIEGLQFITNPDNASKPYIGYLEVIARRGAAEVASLINTSAHPVEVYPYLSISPLPSDNLINQVLAKREGYCTKFALTLDAGNLPHPNRPEYAIRAILAPDAKLLNQELNKASFTLDGFPLEFESKPRNPLGDWNKGRLLKKDELFGEHELCVTVGDPKNGSRPEMFKVPLKFTLMESPYNDLPVIKDFTLKMRIEPPIYVPLWISSLLSFLAIFLWWWYFLRNRPTLAPDLGYALGSKANELKTMPLGEGSLIARLLGLTVEKPITTENEEQILAWVRPIKNPETLYQLRLEKDVSIELVSTSQSFPSERHIAAQGMKNIEIQRTYIFHSNIQDYYFRMEYY